MIMPSSAGPNSARIEIGGITLELEFSDAELFDTIARRYKDFLTDGDARFKASIHVDEPRDGASLIDAPFIFQGNALTCEASGCSAFIDPVNSRGNLSMSAVYPVEQVEYYLRLVVALLAYEAGGMLFHAAAVVHRGRGYVFFGCSGSGKSTVARLSPQEVILNDDLVLLKHGISAWNVYSTPFWNRNSIRPAVDFAPVAGLYHLVKSENIYLEPLPAPFAVAEMLSCIPVVNADMGRTATLIDRCQKILEFTPAYRLHFLRDVSFWHVVDAET